jgi:ABC-type Mn2+/Zn2+ transport system ATPase subunit
MGSLQTIEIRNFKAFRDFTLKLDGRHLLLYGANGSGKSSLFWALHAFLESAGKTQVEIQKYFDPTHKESLVNIDANPLDTTAAALKLTVKEGAGVEKSYEISHAEHQTAKQPQFAKASLASDFITYRFFFKFSNFTNRADFEIWPLFEHEILPFCATPKSDNLRADWRTICKRCEDSVTQKSRGKAANNDRAFLEKNTAEFATNLNDVIEIIAKEAKAFYAKYFAKDDVVPLELHLRLATKPAYHHDGKRIEVPKILFGITKAGAAPRNIERPQTFLNEAKLTQIAISIRLAASLVMLKQSPLKLLVLDDLLVSLDMSNRMKVVEIILSETFADYQKIILTHDLGFFQEFRRMIGSASPNWGFYQLSSTLGLAPFKSDLETAMEYLEQGQIAECGNRLRKCVEANLTTFLEQAKQKKGLDHLIDRETFASLHHKLNEATAQLSLESYHQFAELIQSNFSQLQLGELASPEEIDVAKFNALPRDKKGAVIAKLYAARRDLQQCIIELLSDASRKRLTAIKLLEEVRRIKDRILNPASHAGAAPLYTKEAEDAVKVIQALDAALSAALATL